MKKVLAILLCCSLLLQCMARYSAIALYKLRKEYIARNLCDNRDKPALKCCGKCYLRKQLRKVDESHKPTANTSSKTDRQEEQVIYILPFVFTGTGAWRQPLVKIFNPAGQHMSGDGVLNQVFHPPPLYS